jgi:DNA mismatch repair protein MutL
MGKIRVLSDKLANQIAAGEVVERPASVVKELLENSLDAGATRITIEIEAGGRRLLKISDNGEGMIRDDAVLAFERHATSKIRVFEDLNSIATLGFRGEALASIASVARVELTPKNAEDSAATKVVIEGGRLIDVKDAAHPTGTTIVVRDLFFNVPARRKFLRSEATENFHLINLVTHYALAHPDKAFTLLNNNRETMRITPARSLRERAFQIFGNDFIESLLTIDGGHDFIAHVSGFISAPRERRTSKDAQYFFINKRFVRDKILARALTEGYRSVLPHGVYPVALLFVDVPPEEVDVNVHPSKIEVRFRRPEAVRESVTEAVRAALASAGIIPSTLVSNDQDSTLEAQEPISDLHAPNLNSNLNETVAPNIFEQQNVAIKVDDSNVQSTVEFTIPIFEENAPSFESLATENSVEADPKFEFNTQAIGLLNNSPKTDDRKSETQHQTTSAVENWANSNNPHSEIRNQQTTVPPLDSAAKLPKMIDFEKLSSSGIRPIGQLHESYIIATDNEGLLLFDQHVVHERILFDKFRKRLGEQKIDSQNLLLPETLDLTPAQASAFDLVENELEECGFSLMRLSGRTVAIKAVPAELAPAEARNLLREILETIDLE